MKGYLEMTSSKTNISKLIAKKSIYLYISFLLLLFIAIAGCSKKEERKLSKELNVYNWSYYIGETTIKDFEKEFDIKVNYDNYSSNEELLAKLQTGVAGYDVIFPSDYMVKIMSDQKLLANLNIENIPNYENIDRKFINLPFDPGNKYSIPYQWGTAGLGINISKISENATDWDILWNEKYKGRITMLNDMRFGLVPALKKLGYSINTTNPTQLEEAKQLMMRGLSHTCKKLIHEAESAALTEGYVQKLVLNVKSYVERNGKEIMASLDRHDAYVFCEERRNVLRAESFKQRRLLHEKWGNLPHKIIIKEMESQR